MSKMPLGDRRNLARLPLTLPLYFRSDTSRNMYQATCFDIHPTGIQIETDAPLTPNMTIELCLEDYERNSSIFVHGDVRWTQPAKENKVRCGIILNRKINWPIPLPTLVKAFSQESDYLKFSSSRFVLDSISDGVMVVDKDMRITSMNPAAERVMGRSFDETVGKRCHDVLQCSTCEEGCVLAESIRTNKQFMNRSLFITNVEGKKVAASINTAPLVNDDGEVIGGVQIFCDINTLMDSALILNNLTEGVFTVDKEWRITSFNRAAEKITGLLAADILGKKCNEVFQSNICGDNCAIAKSLETGAPEINNCISMQNAANEKLSVSVCASPLYDRLGNVIGGVETFRKLPQS